jgi:hypothetical protein
MCHWADFFDLKWIISRGRARQRERKPIVAHMIVIVVFHMWPEAIFEVIEAIFEAAGSICDTNLTFYHYAARIS